MGSDDFETIGPRRDTGAAVFLVLMVLIGSTTATAAKYAVKEVPLGFLPLARFGLAGLCLLPIAWRGGALARMIRHDLPRLLATAAFCIPINQSFFLAGTRMAPTSHTGVIYATCPLVVLLLASAMGQERMVMQRLMGVVLSVAGVVVIGAGNLLKAGGGDFQTLRGDLLLVGAVVSWGAYLTANKPLVAKYGAMPTLAGTFLVGSLIQIPITWATFPGIEAFRAISAAGWWTLLYMALVVTIFGLYCQNQAMQRLDASQVATFGNVAPLLTIVWGVVLHGDELGAPLVIGALLTLGGIVWASWPVNDRTWVVDSERWAVEEAIVTPLKS
jgi:drug/metabolite transporter (DMT)-like permease